MITHEALLGRLSTRWSADGVPAGEGAAENQIRQFEAFHGVRLPEDFRTYLLLINGMVPGHPHVTDQRGFFFWPLTQMRSAYAELATNESRETPVPDESLKGYLVFADYLHWSWAYALNVTSFLPSHGEVVKVDEPARFGKLTDNFTEFLRLYLDDAPILYESV